MNAADEIRTQYADVIAAAEKRAAAEMEEAKLAIGLPTTVCELCTGNHPTSICPHGRRFIREIEQATPITPPPDYAEIRRRRELQPKIDKIRRLLDEHTRLWADEIIGDEQTEPPTAPASPPASPPTTPDAPDGSPESAGQ